MIRKLSLRDLKPGMYVVRMPQSPLLDPSRVYGREGFIRSEEEILSIARQGFSEVFVDLRAVPEMPRAVLRPGLHSVPVQEEVQRARAAYAQAVRVVRSLFQDAAAGRPLALDAARESVEEMVGSAERNTDALCWASRLEAAGAVLLTHSVNVSVLSLAFALHLGLDRARVLEIGLAGMLHDVGQVQLPPDLVNKPTPLSNEERLLFQTHAAKGAQMLRSQGGLAPDVVWGVLEHHERHDGKGYPQGLRGGERRLCGRILSLADRFESLVRPRLSRVALPPHQAMTMLYVERGKAFAEEDVERFVRFMGVYPTGSVVRLTDGRTGVVWQHDPENPLAPLVNLVFEDRPHAGEEGLLNLAVQNELRAPRIKEALDPIVAGIRPDLFAPGLDA